MKKVLLQLVCCMLVGGIVQAQQAQMNYYAARQISGETSSQDASVSGTGTNYILLHEAYDGIEMPLDHFVMGKISAIRGSGAPNPAAWNLKMTLEVNTASAFQTNRANLVSYNETGYSIVKVMYNSKRYLAIKIPLGSSIFNLTFTGYAQNELLQLVWNIEPLNNGTQDIAATETPLLPSEFDDNTFSGDVGIGTNSPLHRLDVVTHNATQPSTDNNEIYSIADKGDAKIGLQNLNNTWSISSIGSWSTSNAGDLAITDETGRNIPIFIHSAANGGGVGIGTNSVISNYKLAVEGTIGARKVKVIAPANGWPDYVFDSSYALTPLKLVEKYIVQNKHLPNVPSAATVAKDGLDLGDNQAVLLKKIEELTLYMIEMQKKNEELQKRIELLEKKK